MVLHFSPNLFVALFFSLIYCNKCNEIGLSTINQTYESCPSVFVIPDIPNSDRIEWVQGEKCARKCISPVWTDQEWNVLRIINLSAMWIGLPLDIIVLITWGFSRVKRKQYFVLTFAAFSLMLQTTMVLNSLHADEKVFCSSNSVTILPEDGMTLCNAQSFIGVYSVNGASLSWMLQAVDLFIVVILRKNYTQKLKPIFLGIMFGVPFFLALTLYITQSYGYQQGSVACMVNGIYLTYLIYFPIFLCMSIGAVCVLSVISKIIHHNFNISMKVTTNSTSSSEIYKMVKGAALFLLSFLFLAFPVIAFRFYSYVHIHNGATFPLADMKPWEECIFKYYDGDDASWRSKCGVHPPNRIPFALAIFQSLSTHGTALLVSSTYLIQPSVWKIWYRWLCTTNRSSTGNGNRVNNTSYILSLFWNIFTCQNISSVKLHMATIDSVRPKKVSPVSIDSIHVVDES